MGDNNTQVYQHYTNIIVFERWIQEILLIF